MSGRNAATAAIRSVEVPIAGAEIVAARESQSVRGAVDGQRLALNFEKYSQGSLIKIEVQPRKHESGSKFLVTKAGAKADGMELGDTPSGMADYDFAFELDLKARARGGCRRRRFHGERRAALAGAQPNRAKRRRGFDAHTEEGARAAKVQGGCVVQGVGLEDPAKAARAQRAYLYENQFEIGDGKLDLGFAVRLHVESITRAPSPCGRAAVAWGGARHVFRKTSDDRRIAGNGLSGW